MALAAEATHSLLLELGERFDAADPKFAADSRARLAWWFAKSKYEPEENGRYPIVRVWEKNW